MAQVTADSGVQSKGARKAIRDFLQYSPGMVKPQDVILFCRQLASFVRVGVTVTVSRRAAGDKTISTGSDPDTV